MHIFRKPFLFVTAIVVGMLFVPFSAQAQCTSPTGAAGTKEWFSGEATYKYCIGTAWVSVPTGDTLGACSQAGAWDYDATEDAFKQCDGSDWQKVICADGGGSSGPTGCSNPGDECDDGSHFVGDTNLYVTDVDQHSGLAWAPSDSGNTGATSHSDGSFNQDWIIANKTLSNFPAFEICANLSRHGYDDWYLPARNEAQILATYRADIGGMTGPIYWTSTQNSSYNGRADVLDTSPCCGIGHNGKSFANDIRCVRRETGGGSSCTSLGSCSTAGSVDFAGGVARFCDGADLYALATPDLVAPVWQTAAGTIASINISTVLSGVTVTATDDSGSVTYSKQSGDAWLSVNSSTGAITGTSPGTGATYSITVRASDGTNYVDRAFNVVVSAGDVTPPTWTTASGNLGTGFVGIAIDSYNFIVAATDAGGAVTYSKQSGDAWISVNSSSGLLMGTPDAVGTANFTIRATDPSGNYTDRAFQLTKSNIKVLCTYYNSRDMLSDALLSGDLAYAVTVDPQVGRAYRAWANPLIAYLRDHEGSWADQFVFTAVEAWAQEMAYRTGNAEKGSTLGWILSTVGEPLHYLAGYFITESDDEKELREKLQASQTNGMVQATR